MRILLFTGKGGVGKSTLAAATASHAAATGHRTLLISTDAAHSLGDIVESSDIVEPSDIVESSRFLDIEQVDITSRRAASWQGIESYLRALLIDLGVGHVEAAELTNLPAIDDVLALLEVAERIRQGTHDVVVIDAPPTAETMRFLTLPEALATLLGKFGTTRAALARFVTDVPRAPREVFAAIEAAVAECVALRELLTGSTTSIRVVTTADSVVLAETRRTVGALALHGYRVDAVIANRVFGYDHADEWRMGWAVQHEKQLSQMAHELVGIPLLVGPYAQKEPVGVAALVELATSVYGDRDPLEILGVTPGHRWHPVDGGFEYIVPMPFTRLSEVHATRVDDDLVISVASSKRSFPLPSVLRRCSIAGATFSEESLYIQFVPNPELWPSDEK